MADLALEWLFAGVSPVMDLEGARPHEALATQIALEWPFACVTPHMVTQVPVGRESATAIGEGALERFLTVVDPHVRLQVTFLCEALAAALELADEWFLAQVSPLVDLQTARPRVAFATNVALEGLVARVDQLVRLQVPLRDEPLVAARVRALEWPLTSLFIETQNKVVVKNTTGGTRRLIESDRRTY